jgi:hypothetical protein
MAVRISEQVLEVLEKKYPDHKFVVHTAVIQNRLAKNFGKVMFTAMFEDEPRELHGVVYDDRVTVEHDIVRPNDMDSWGRLIEGAKRRPALSWGHVPVYSGQNEEAFNTLVIDKRSGRFQGPYTEREGKTYAENLNNMVKRNTGKDSKPFFTRTK